MGSVIPRVEYRPGGLRAHLLVELGRVFLGTGEGRGFLVDIWSGLGQCKWRSPLDPPSRTSTNKSGLEPDTQPTASVA